MIFYNILKIKKILFSETSKNSIIKNIINSIINIYYTKNRVNYNVFLL
jgi:hypothetical protein